MHTCGTLLIKTSKHTEVAQKALIIIAAATGATQCLCYCSK